MDWTPSKTCHATVGVSSTTGSKVGAKYVRPCIFRLTAVDRVYVDGGRLWASGQRAAAAGQRAAMSTVSGPVRAIARTVHLSTVVQLRRAFAVGAPNPISL